MAVPALVIDENGCAIPTFADCQAYLVAGYQEIYGSDTYLANDSEDGQIIGLFALAMSQCFNAGLAVFNSFSPGKAVGVGLSSLVKINGIQRAIPSSSTVDLRIVGQAGTIIQNGIATSEAQELDWLLPAEVIIPDTGEITVTATAAEAGANLAAANTITRIQTPQFGWQSVNNLDAASPGAPLETNAALRRRQGRSVALPSRTVIDGIAGAILALDGVTKVMPYENDTSATDANGLPEHSISMVVTGGDATEIANTILMKKTPGAYTYGDVAVTLYTSSVPTIIRFFRPDVIDLKVAISIDALPGYSSEIGQSVRQALVDYIEGLGDGDDVLYSRLYSPANLNGAVEGQTYDITSLQVAKLADPLGTSNIVIAFNAKARLLLENVTLTEL